MIRALRAVDQVDRSDWRVGLVEPWQPDRDDRGNRDLNGTYTLLVTDSAVSREPSHAGTYVVTMFKGPGTFVVPTGDHGGTLLNNVARAGAIYRGDLDEWTFLAAIGHALTVTISEIISGTDPGFIPWIRLIGPTGAVVGQALGVQTATINLVAPTTGIYTVIVADSDVSREGAAPGNYTLTAIGVDPNVCDGGAVAGITTIGAADVVSMRERINTVRGRFGLPLFNFTDANPAGMPVKATHFQELRSALQDAYVAGGQAVPTYTDPGADAPVHVHQGRAHQPALRCGRFPGMTSIM